MGKNHSTNMETYYGFQIIVDNSIDPISEEKVRLKVREHFREEGVSQDDYLVYFHNLNIISNSQHFGLPGGLSARASEIGLHFQVNQKQMRAGSIRFLNYFYENTIDTNQVRRYSSTHYVGFSIDASYFDRQAEFGSVLVTYMDRALKTEHRKIKLSVSAIPTAQYRSIFAQSNLIRTTQRDLRYNRSVQLRLPSLERDPMQDDSQKTPGTIFNIHGSVGNINNTNSGEITSSVVLSAEFLSDLSRLSNYMKASIPRDNELISRVDDAVIKAKSGDAEGVWKLLKDVSGRLATKAADVGAKVLEAWVKAQIGLGA